MRIPVRFLCEHIGYRMLGSDIEVEGVRLFDGNTDNLEPHMLYIVDTGGASAVDAMISDRSSAFLESDDAAGCLNGALKFMERVQDWEGEVASSLLHPDGDGLDGLMRLFSKLLGNAAYLVDSSLKVIAIDDDPAFQDMSAIWRHIVRYGFIPLDIASGMQSSGELDNLDRTKPPVLFKSDFFNNEFINCNLWVDGQLWGHLFFVGYQKKITRGDVLMAGKLGEIASEVIEDREAYVVPHGREHENFFRHMIDGSLSDVHLISQQLGALGWKMQGCYIVAALRVPGDDAVLRELLCSSLEDSASCKTVIVGLDVFAVFAMSNATGAEQIAALLNARVRADGTTAGISDTFMGFEHLSVYAEQARVAREMSGGASRVSCYREHAVEHLLVHLDSGFDRAAFCDPAVFVLADHDRAQGTEYLRTLEAYLECGCNLVTSASRLVVHRNTMVYRIGRIVEMTQIDLADPRVIERLRLSLRLCDLP